MYRAIYDMALNLGLKPTPGFREKVIKAHVVLDESGNYQRIEVSSDKKSLCPDKPFKLKGFTGRYSAQFLVDHALTVLYTQGLSNDEDDKYSGKHQNYEKQIKMGADEGIGLLKPVDIFMQKYDSDQVFRDSILKDLEGASIKLKTDNLSFRVGERNVDNDMSCLDYFRKMAGLCDEKDSQADGYYSAITGRNITPITEKFPQWKGGRAGTGIPVFSSSLRGPNDAQKAATKSYGSRIDCPMSMEEANTIISGLDYVMNKADQYDPDFGICWWYDSKVRDDTIRKTVSRWQRSVEKKKSSEDPTEEIHEKQIVSEKRSEDYKDLLLAVENGQEPETKRQEYRYHIVCVSFPSKGRMLCDNEYSDTYQALNQHLTEWYDDSCLMVSGYNGKEKRYKYNARRIKNIYEILYALKLASKDGGKDGKYSMFRKEKYGLLKAVYTGSQIPDRFFRMAVEQYTRYICFNPDDVDKHISEGNAQCILELEKLFLIRNGGYQMEKELTPDNVSIGYQCGRWLAVIDKLQEESLKQSGKKVNRTLSAKYYKQAKKTPAKVFSILNDYIKVYEDRLTDFRSVYEKNFGEISEKIGTYFPERLSIKEQGAFDLGFAQQKQAFYKKSNKVNTETDCKEMEED